MIGRWFSLSPDAERAGQYRQDEFAPSGLRGAREESAIRPSVASCSRPGEMDGQLVAMGERIPLVVVRSVEARHTLVPVAIVTFPDGSRVRAASLTDRREDDPERAYGLYLDQGWAPTWPADVIAWPDFGLPVEPEVAAGRISSCVSSSTSRRTRGSWVSGR